MSEEEKMANEQWYFASDKSLSAMRMQAKDLCFEFNHTKASDTKTRKRLLKALLPNAKGVWAEPSFYCDYGFNIYAKSGLFINHNVTMLDGAKISIGENCFIGPNTVLACTSHHMDSGERARGLCRSKPISIGDNVWIGANVTIVGGVSIPDNSVIGAGEVLR